MSVGSLPSSSKTQNCAGSAPALFDPLGPWELETSLLIPDDPAQRINFTTTNPKANISISHCVKVIIRVDRGDDEFLDAHGKRKRWDIVVEAGVHVLSVGFVRQRAEFVSLTLCLQPRCAQSALPAYSTSSPVVRLPPASTSRMIHLGRPAQALRASGSGYDPSAALELAATSDQSMLLTPAGEAIEEEAAEEDSMAADLPQFDPPSYSSLARGRSATPRVIAV